MQTLIVDKSRPSLGASEILVIGAGIMGAGIAQVAAQSGQTVQLYDARAGAAEQAKARLAVTLEGLVAKGKLSPATVQATLSRIVPVDALVSVAGIGLAVEAIVEDLQAKRALFSQLESMVSADCVLASNTSSISITALANGMAHPGRLVGMHFFNPVPLMKLVEVVSGLHTEAAVADAVFDLAVAWGKVPVHARSTPGFIVNRIARPYYAETLALLAEQAADPQSLDACLRAAGFRMGPCELMDLIGHDTNFAVTNSVYEANFFDKRFVPSLVQRELVDGGLLGRKTQRGFYRYPEGAPPLPAPPASPAASSLQGREVTVHGEGAIADRLAASVAASLGGAGPQAARDRASSWIGVTIDGARLVLTDGRCASEWCETFRSVKVAVFDRPMASSPSAALALAYAVPASAGEAWAAQAAAWLVELGHAPVRVADTPGLVVARTIAMLINEAADAVLQGVCTTAGADSAMQLGVNYPAGPFEWLSAWGARNVASLLDALDAQYRGERYRVSPWLRRFELQPSRTP